VSVSKLLAARRELGTGCLADRDLRAVSTSHTHFQPAWRIQSQGWLCCLEEGQGGLSKKVTLQLDLDG
jgi:hypothetical protein